MLIFFRIYILVCIIRRVIYIQSFWGVIFFIELGYIFKNTGMSCEKKFAHSYNMVKSRTFIYYIIIIL